MTARRAEPREPRDGAALQALTARVNSLETMVEALQDAVHRQARSHDERFEQLVRKTEPGELARALSEDSRRRGL
jgi:hypothetical protein